MIEISKTEHTYIVIPKVDLFEMIQFHFSDQEGTNVPDSADVTLSPDGVIIEFTKNSGPHLPTPEQQRISEMSREDWAEVQTKL